MPSRALAVLVAAGAVVPAGAELCAQTPFQTVARTGVFFETYAFGSGLAFDRISELTIPLSLTQRFGRLTLDIGTAYARASVREPGGSTIDHSGLVDTDVRAAVAIVPGRFLLTLAGTLPTGATEVADTTVPLFGATATDLLGFTTPGFGSGGGMSAGFASAFQVGERWAAGAGASYRYGASYTPVSGGTELAPGGEMRLRVGVEGPFGGNKYFRGAFVYTTSAANDLGDGRESAIGARALAYASVGMPLGRSNLFFWGWEMRRLSPENVDTSTVVVPRGNVLALGARLERPLSPAVTLVPMVEFRHELTGPGARMELLGYLVRTGADLRIRFGAHAAVVLQAQLAVGTLREEGQSVSVVGPRLGTLLEWSR